MGRIRTQVNVLGLSKCLQRQAEHDSGEDWPLKEEDKEFISCAWAKMFMYVGHQAEILR